MEHAMSYRSRWTTCLAVLLAFVLAIPAVVGFSSNVVIAQDDPTEVTGDLEAENWTWPVYNVIDGEQVFAMYEPIDPTEITQQWNICVSFPHLKDPYWLGANYGIVQEIERDGATMQLFEAGGYTELSTQLSQLDDCVAQGADAIIIGAISLEGVNAKVEEIVEQGIPVIDFVNGISSPDVSAHALVDFTDMGRTTGEYMRELIGDEEATVAFFPGPQGAGWTDVALAGFEESIEGTNIEIVDVKWGDTGRDIQLSLIEDTLQAHEDIDYIVGNAQAAVSAVQAVAEAGRENDTQIYAFHQNPPVYDLVETAEISGSANDHTVVQARMAVDMAIRLLEGQELETNRAGPVITMMTPDNLDTFVWASTFAPTDFQPVFTVGERT
jgi:periplasmic protein TorT